MLVAALQLAIVLGALIPALLAAESGPYSPGPAMTLTRWTWR